MPPCRTSGGYARAVSLLLITLLAQPSVAKEDRSTSRPASTKRTVHRTKPAPESEEVAFVTEDNMVITGSYTPPKVKRGEKAPMVILLHMYKHERSTYEPLVPHLYEAGLAVLAIDMRGHGDSVGPAPLGLAQRAEERDPKLFRNMEKDVTAAYLWLCEQEKVDPARYLLVGASVGCSVGLRTAAGDRSVDGVVCMTPGTAYLGIDSVSDVKAYGDRPLLLLASTSERSASEELGSLVPRAEVVIVPGGGDDRMELHGTRMFGKVPDVEKTITEFLVRAAGPPPTDPVVASVQSDVYHAADSGTAKRISDKNLRWFSSAEEAASRGLRSPKKRSKADSSVEDGEPFPDP